MKKVSKTTFVAVFSLAVLAAVSLITLINHGTDGVVNVSNETLNNMVNPLGGPIESTAGTTDVQPATTVDMTPVAEAVKEVAEKSNAAIEKLTETLSSQKATETSGPNAEAATALEKGRKYSSELLQSAIMGKEAGNPLRGEMWLVAAGVDKDRYGGEIQTIVGNHVDKVEMAAKLGLLNSESIEKNTAGVKNLFNITLAGDKRFNEKERGILTQFSYDAREGTFLQTAAQSERDDIQKQLKNAYARAERANSRYSKLKANYDNRLKTLQVKEDGSMETSVTKPIIWAVQ